MKKILILGGSHRDIPLIKAAQDLGYFVITLGDRDYYLGHNYSNKAYKINFNDISEVKKIIEKEKITYLLPGSGEESYLNTVKLSHQLGIGNFDTLKTAKLVHDKWKFKEFCLQHNISTPRGKFYTKPDDFLELKYPVVVKPTNLSGGRGVDIVYTEEELLVSINKSQKVSDSIFLEEFIDGKLIAYSVFLKDQKIHYGFTGEDIAYLNKYLITSAFPYKIDQNVLKKLKQDIEKLATILSLVNGMFHLQILIKDATPYIIDVTRRIPGDLYPNLIEYCDGVQYSKAVVKGYTTGIIKDEFISNFHKQKFVIRHVVMPTKNGIFQKIEIDPSIQNKIIDSLYLVHEGYKIENYLSTQIAIIFLQLDSRDSDIVNNINNLIKLLYIPVL